MTSSRPSSGEELCSFISLSPYFQWTAHVQNRKRVMTTQGQRFHHVRQFLKRNGGAGWRTMTRENWGREELEASQNTFKWASPHNLPCCSWRVVARAAGYQEVFIQIPPSGFSMLVSLVVWCCIGQGRDGSVSPPARIIWSWLGSKLQNSEALSSWENRHSYYLASSDAFWQNNQHSAWRDIVPTNMS